MIALIRKYKKLLIIIIFPYLYLLMVMSIPTQQAVIAPGGISPVSQAIIVEEVEMKDNFNTVFVFSYHPLTPLQSWVLSIDDMMDVRPISQRQQDLSHREKHLQGQISKTSSFHISLIQAYQLAAQVDFEIEIDYNFSGLYIYFRPSRISNLEIGDVIVGVNGHSYLNYSANEFLLIVRDAIKNSSLEEPTELKIRGFDGSFGGYEVEFVVFEADDLTMLFHPKYIINSATPKYSIPGLDGPTGGPSGGLMQTLAIYASLLNINIGNDLIAGTGTIEMSGEIGRIGGVPQKVFSAIENEVDIFFLPKTQISNLPNVETEMIIVPVETIYEAVNWLKEHYDG